MKLILRNVGFFMSIFSIRRKLPTAWEQVPQRRRIAVLRALLTNQGMASRLEALRILLNIRRRTWNRIALDDLQAILNNVPWLKAEPSPIPIIPHTSYLIPFKVRPTTYLLPDANFANGSCIEFAMADELMDDLMKGNEKALPLLTATLLREKDPNEAEAIKREDLRVKLHGRMEVEQRAKRQRKLPHEVHVATLLYFIGVKQLVHRLYGQWLFEQEDPDDNGPKKPGDPLRWWGMYMDAAGGDLAKLEVIQQGNFHNFCTMAVRQRKQAKEAAIQGRLASTDFGIVT